MVVKINFECTYELALTADLMEATMNIFWLGE